MRNLTSVRIDFTIKSLGCDDEKFLMCHSYHHHITKIVTLFCLYCGDPKLWAIMIRKMSFAIKFQEIQSRM